MTSEDFLAETQEIVTALEQLDKEIGALAKEYIIAVKGQKYGISTEENTSTLLDQFPPASATSEAIVHQVAKLFTASILFLSS